jgi:hypothetical protein
LSRRLYRSGFAEWKKNRRFFAPFSGADKLTLKRVMYDEDFDL